MPDASPNPPQRHDDTLVGTIQSLIVAFVLAMTFRGFVTEGFVIPTGSMAPTLLGQNVLLRAPQTGAVFPVGIDARQSSVSLANVADPTLGPQHPGSGASSRGARPRMGDRILVLKSLYPFVEPNRFDVVVFKNPTNPNGEDGNYIKRLIGLPNEAIWIADGDIFTAPANQADDLSAFRVQRKPEHVQRAVWQTIADSDFIPLHPESLDSFYRGPPWLGARWETEGRRVYRCDTAEPTTLAWDGHKRQLIDWAPYNEVVHAGQQPRPIHVIDLRIAAAITPDADGLEAVFEIQARDHVFRYELIDGAATVRMRSGAWGAEFPDEGWDGAAPVPVGDVFTPGTPVDVEFWHVDQSMVMFVNGARVTEHHYEWTPEERLQHAALRQDDAATLAVQDITNVTKMEWRFRGSPLDLARVRVDRDLYYRSDRLNDHTYKNPDPPFGPTIPRDGNFAFGTHPNNLAVLDGDQFFMLGDNSSASSDSRLWGYPHPLVAEQIDPSPFVVNRALLLGKAWVVYFPAPYPMKENGRAFIPDFGRLRFIR